MSDDVDRYRRRVSAPVWENPRFRKASYVAAVFGGVMALVTSSWVAVGIEGLALGTLAWVLGALDGDE